MRRCCTPGAASSPTSTNDARLIRQGVAAAAERIGGIAVIEDALLDEVTALVEWPVPLAGRFDAKFLELPPEVPIATMQDHQRYFPVRNAHGALLPWFVTVSNIESHGSRRRSSRATSAWCARACRTRRFSAAPTASTARFAYGSVAARDVPDATRLAARQERTRARSCHGYRRSDRRRTMRSPIARRS